MYFKILAKNIQKVKFKVQYSLQLQEKKPLGVNLTKYGLDLYDGNYKF